MQRDKPKILKKLSVKKSKIGYLNSYTTGIHLAEYKTNLADGTIVGFDADMGDMVAYKGKVISIADLPKGIKTKKFEKGGAVKPKKLKKVNILSASNGKPSNLTPEQYKLVRTPAFKAWFGDWETDPKNASKVVDENGEPLIMYHGTPDKKFFEFKNDLIELDRDDRELKSRFWFTSELESAETYSRKRTGSVENVYKIFLNIRNPKNNFNIYLDDVNDGSIQKSSNDSIVAIAIQSTQIKLADGTNTTFDSGNADIRFAEGGSVNLAPNGKKSNLTPEQYKLVRTPEFKAWFGDWENDPKNASKVVDENGEPLLVWHGSNVKFNIFKKGEFGFHFAAKREQSEERGNIIKPYFLRIINLWNFDYDLGDWNDWEMWSEYANYFEEEPVEEIFKESHNTEEFKNNLQKLYDGLIYLNHIENSRNINNNMAYIAFHPNQIKLADGTNTTFDSNSNDIRFADGGEISEDDIITAKNWWHQTLSLNEQNKFIKEYAPEYLPDYMRGVIYGKNNHTILNIWKEEGSPTHSEWLEKRYGYGNLTDKNLGMKIYYKNHPEYDGFKEQFAEGGEIKYYQVEKQGRPVLKVKFGKSDDAVLSDMQNMLDGLADKNYALKPITQQQYKEFEHAKVDNKDLVEFIKSREYFADGGVATPPELITECTKLYEDHHATWDKIDIIEKEVSQKSANDFANQIVLIWENEMKAHFVDEEQNFFPSIVNVQNTQAIDELIAEHLAIYQLIEKIKEHGNEQDILTFCAIIKNHIQKEEVLMNGVCPDKFKDGGKINNRLNKNHVDYDLKEIKLLGYTTDFNVCDCCGKENLRGTIAILDLTHDVILHFGTTCAVKADKYDTLEAFNKAKKEINAEVRRVEEYKRFAYGMRRKFNISEEKIDALADAFVAHMLNPKTKVDRFNWESWQ